MTTETVHRPAVVGAGVMGTNIATMMLGHGVPVLLVDTSDERLERARTAVRNSLRHARLMRAFPEGVEEGELTTSTALDGLRSATAVIEAIVEDAAAKVDLLGDVSLLVGPDVPLISNTSGIPIDELADATARPERMLGTHFMNPTFLIPMVEVIRARRTAPETLDAVRALLTDLGRTPVVVNDSPGFVTSRLLHPMINEAARLVGEDVTDADAVDTLMQGCLGHPTGPLRTADMIGLDNLADALNVLSERTGNPTFAPCDTLLEKVRAGDLGRKTGRGFFDYGKALS